MFCLKVFIILLTYLATCCNTQYYNSYRYPIAAQRRAGYYYPPPPSYYNQANSYYSNSSPIKKTASSSGSYYNSNKPKSYYSSNSAASLSDPSKSYYRSSNRYKEQSLPNSAKVYSTPSNSQYNGGQSYTQYSPYSSASQLSSEPKVGYSTASNSYNSNNKDTSGSRKRVSKADSENAKFAGADNQEDVQDNGKTLLRLKKRRLLRHRLGSRYGGNPCSPYGRDAAAGGGKSVSSTPKEQGRFLWGINVYNVYGGGCGGGGGGVGLFNDPGLGGGGGGGGGGVGGLLSDPAELSSGITSFLNVWAPGVLQAATARPPLPPPPYADYNRPYPGNRPVSAQIEDDDLQTDPDVDPNYGAQPIRRPRPNPGYFDSPGVAPVTPGQLVGGIATTVNSIIQQLSGNAQPVYY